METTTPRQQDDSPAAARAWLSLALLVVVYVFNFVDRQILAILATHIKADLQITDAQLGFLYGTAFAVFYSVFGIPLGLLADLGNRRSLIGAGLAFWSAMTALSGFARTFPQLALARVGVGIGEASASPAAYSLLTDLFPKRQRATALALYSSGIYIGAGLGLFIGGFIVDRWDAAYAAGGAPFGLAGWQAAFLAVGLPGIILTPLVLGIPEPVRGSREGLQGSAHARPIAAMFEELLSLMPPTSWILLGRRGGSVGANLAAALAVGLVAWGLSVWTGNWTQWTALGFGVLVALTYAQQVRLSDPPAYALIFKTPSLALATLGFSFLAFNGYSISFWVPSFYVRYHGMSAQEVGGVIGAISSLGGLIGVTLGGVLADRWRRVSPAGRLWVGLANALVPVPFFIWSLFAEASFVSLALFTVVQIAAALWLGAGISTVQDLVLPRMRARASAVFLLFVTLIGLALGPYVVGRLSDLFADLRLAMLAGLVTNLIAAAFFFAASRTIGPDEASREDRARSAGERLG
jgi:MFS family permease